MEFDAVLLPPRRARMVAQGHWHDRTINDALDACVAACPDKLALTALQVETGATTRFTYRELASMADRIAVMTHRPGRIKSILDVELARPRPAEIRHSPAFVHLREQAWDILRDEVAFASGHRQQPLAPLMPTAPDYSPVLRGFAI